MEVNDICTNGMTDHFVTIMGMTIDLKTGETSYRFFDPGSSSGNRDGLFITPKSGFLTGETAVSGKPFTVTTVRRNKKL